MEPADDVLTGGSAGGPRRPVPRWGLALVAVVVAAGVLIAAGRGSGRPVPPAPPAATDLGRPLLDGAGGWELFVRGEREVVRIQPASGRVTRTAVPALRSNGPVSFVVTGDRAILHPLDVVPGYAVADGKAAAPLPATLSEGGRLFPGPDDGHVWAQTGNPGPPAMVLRPVDGGSDGASIPMQPEDLRLDVTGDGAGYLLYTSTGGVYDARPAGMRRITPGALLAVGPKGWLVRDCDDRQRCGTALVDRATGARRTVRTPDGTDAPRGLLSPDGTGAALYTVGPAGRITLQLVELGTGTAREVDVPIDQSVGDGTLAWSPDGRTLFAVGADGRPRVVDRATGETSALGVPITDARQLAVRTIGSR